MPITASAATVLHAQDYLESSRIYRLLLRDAGMVSVVARGVRRAGRTATSPPDLFATGVAQVDLKPGRDLHALRDFEATSPRLGLGRDLPRFLAAGALAEVALRFVADEASPSAYDAVVDGLDALAVVPAEQADGAALGALWALVQALGFAPTLDRCASCGRPVADEPGDTLLFHHRSGGVLCAACAVEWVHPEAGRAVGGRRLPRPALAQIGEWMAAGGERGAPSALDTGACRAHQRLLREFLAEHLSERRPLRAYGAWESGGV
ncbi:MAG: DNA repair protein RecO [Gemmatimonadaceae bacterium]|jgi:DNA repair protein RecO (recombination protein O)|nr:DNA repair protein RecO [Gemmatimonadaceae bacterium]